METTLRMFYARALFVLAFFFLMLFVFAGVAFAQDAATVARQPGLLDVFATSASAALAGILTIATGVVLKQLPTWARGWLEAKSTTESKDWSIYTDAAVNRAKAYAEKKLKGARDSNRYVNLVVEYLHKYEPEIVKWADKNGDGVLDFLEPWLPHSVEPTKPAPAVASVSPMAPRKVTRAKGELVQ